VALALAAALAPGVLAAAPPEVGDRVPDLRLEDLAGASHVLSEWIERGPVVLVFFRGVW
jgi:peroxiredoxin